MDPFSHALWSVVIFKIPTIIRNSPKFVIGRGTAPTLSRSMFWVMLFGIFPDLISNIPFLVWKSVYFYVLGLPVTDIVFRDWLVLVPPQIYAFFMTIYDTSHSLIVFLLIFFLIFFLNKRRVWLPILAWGLHIGLDIFSHANTIEHGVRIFWPISNLYVGIFMWSSLLFMLVNAASLLAAGLILFIRSRKKLSTGKLTQN